MNPFQFPFDATTVDPTQGAGQLPLGRHPAIITGGEAKATNAANGGMLVLDLSIIDGPNKGQTGVYRLNLWNANPKACEIAQRQLSALCHVTGRFKLNGFNDLNGVPFQIEVGYQNGDGPVSPEHPENKGYTEIKKVFDMQGNEPGKKPTNQAPQPAAQSFGASAAQAPQQAPAAAPGWGAPPASAPAPTAAPGWAAPAANPTQAAPAATPPWQQAQAPAGGVKPPWG